MNKIFDIGRPAATQQKPPKTPKNRKKLSQLFFILIVVLVLILVSLFNNKSNQASGDTTIAKNIATTESSPTASSVTPTKTPTTQKSNSASAPEIDKSKISIKILNGSGQNGLAADTKTMLEKDGFVISETGTAKNAYANTTIYYNRNKEAQAILLQGYFTQDVLSEYNPDLTGQFDILIVVGIK